MSLLAKVKALASGSAPPAPRASMATRLGITEPVTLPPMPTEEMVGMGWGVRRAVRWSRDLDRVLNLPRRELRGTDALVEKWTKVLRKPGGTQTIRPIQAHALEEIHEVGGLLGPIGVGHGKGLMNLLAPMAMQNCRVAVLLIPPNLREQFHAHDWKLYEQHWNLPNLAGGRWFVPGRPVLHVVAYSGLSSAAATDLLDRLRPDLIIADEVHNLRRRSSSRTKRFLRYMGAHEEARFCGWSGTITSKSLKDYSSLAELALGDRSPCPTHWPTVEEWATAIDPSPIPAPAGELQRFCKPGEALRSAWRRRLTETPGVVATSEGALGTSLVISERKPPETPPEVAKLIASVRESWERPDGEWFTEAIEVARCLRQMACGFYYRWEFPRGETKVQIDLWKTRRKAWHQELREKLKVGGTHLDSPLLCAKAAIRYFDGYHLKCVECGKNKTDHVGLKHPFAGGPLPVWPSKTWQEWLEVRDTVQPETVPVWVDDWLAWDAAHWIAENVGIVWYEHDAFGQKVAEISKAPLMGPGKESDARLTDRAHPLYEKGDRSVICSINAHKTGKNLPRWSRGLIVSCPVSGEIWEQTLGRQHRPPDEGEEPADEVHMEVYRHTPEMADAFRKAMDLAEYIESTTGQKQKLIYATKEFV